MGCREREENVFLEMTTCFATLTATRVTAVTIKRMRNLLMQAVMKKVCPWSSRTRSPPTLHNSLESNICEKALHMDKNII